MSSILRPAPMRPVPRISGDRDGAPCDGWPASRRSRKTSGRCASEWRLPRTGQARSASYEGEGYIIVRHPRTEVVEEALGRIITQVRVELGT